MQSIDNDFGKYLEMLKNAALSWKSIERFKSAISTAKNLDVKLEIEPVFKITRVRRFQRQDDETDRDELPLTPPEKKFEIKFLNCLTFIQ